MNSNETITIQLKRKTFRFPLLPFFVILLFLCAMLGMIGGASYMGAQIGRQELEIKRTATVSAYVLDRFNKGNQQLQEGKYEIAQANFEEVLRLQPGNFGVKHMLATAISAQTPTPAPTPTPIITDKGELLRRANDAAKAKDWEIVIGLTEQLIALDASFEPDDVSDLRYNALVSRGLQRLRGNVSADIEPGIYDLDRAADIKPLTNLVEGERKTAAAYQNALLYAGADWDRAIALLLQLPGGYRDVSRRLLEAYSDAGDDYAAIQEWCLAEKKYDDALRMSRSATLLQKKEEAARGCLTATPVAITDSLSAEAGAVLSGVTGYAQPSLGGQIIFSAYELSSGVYRPYALDISSGAIRQISRDPFVPGLYSPDNRRYTQSIYDTNTGVWQITVRSATQNITLTQGTSPVWGPSGLIAYQGCTDQCGIHVINPDQPSDLRRLTASTTDAFFKWSPQGDRLVYASNFSGAWELYTVSTNQQFQQLTGYGASTGAPAWSPDGARIAFLSNRDGNWSLYVMQFDGSNTIKLADFGTTLVPAWQSDRIVWSR